MSYLIELLIALSRIALILLILQYVLIIGAMIIALETFKTKNNLKKYLIPYYPVIIIYKRIKKAIWKAWSTEDYEDWEDQ